MGPPTAFVCAILASLFTVASSNNCRTLQAQANGALKSGTYTVQNSAGQSYRIYCQFYSGYGYTFLSTSTNVNVDMSSLYDDKGHVIIRHKRSTGVQYTSTMSQLTAYTNTPVSVQYSANSGYNGPGNTQMAPYIFVGFIPAAMTYRGATQGWKVNGRELTFSNCDGNPNSYIAFFFNPKGQGYSAYVGGHNTLMYQWYDGASVVPSAEYLTDELFANYHEIHLGGCGGYSRGSNVPCGGAVGMKFNIECGVPAKVDGAQMTYTGTAIGHTARYTCLSGYQHTGGDLARTCSGSGAWSGSTPVCGKVTAGDMCYVQNPFGPGLDYKYCSWGCCRVNYGIQCCNVNYNTSLQPNVGYLIGKIVGGVIGLLVLVSILVVCCCIMKRRRARQALVTTNGQPVFGTPGTEMAYVQQPYQPYPIQTNNMPPDYMSAHTYPVQSWQPPTQPAQQWQPPTQPAQPWQPPPYEENKSFKP